MRFIMAKQNVFDNQEFFDGYKKIRERDGNANDLFEIPVLFSLLADLKGKTILDLGRGFGEHCRAFIEKGAQSVVGIDISAKMIEVAAKENSHPAITYLNMPMEDLDRIDGVFDIVVSSLALHYIEDFAGVVRIIYDKTKPGGSFVFSQENPLCTTHSNGNRWTKDKSGNKLYVNLSNYGLEGERQTTWFIENVKKYHRMFSTIVNTLIDAGFTIEKMVEPLPDEELLKTYPDHKDLFHKPDFLIIKAKKQ